MNKARALLLAILAAPTLATAQVDVRVTIPVPSIQFDVAPALVVVSPGIQVVPEYEHEVFFVDGWYWARHDARWFRTRDHRGGWVHAEHAAVPVTLVHIPSGRYRHFKRHHGHAGQVTHVKGPGKPHKAKHAGGKHHGKGKGKK